jgi:hypothetical protein
VKYVLTVIVSLLPMLVGGCASTVNFTDTKALTSAIKVQYNKQDETVTYVGPELRQDDKRLFLSASRNDRIGITYYLITMDTIYMGDLRSYYAACDSGGNKFEFKSILKRQNYCDNSGCWQEESFELSTTRAYLAANQGKDLLIKVTGASNAYQTFTVPATYLKAFLSVVKDL